MNAKKKRTKDRRRARKLAEEAWEAAHEGNLALAVKIIRRAVDRQPANPLLWNDQGLLFLRSDDEQKAAASFQAAISLSPDFADAYANLAEIRVRQGRLQEAIALQSQAARHEPENPRYREALVAYLALAGQTTSAHPAPTEVRPAATSVSPAQDRNIRDRFPELADRVHNLDWASLERQLTDEGCAAVRGFLEAEACRQLREMYDHDELFAKTVVMNKERFGQGVYRYFRAPIPELVDAIRRLVYPHVATIANRWQVLLERDDHFPTWWEHFRAECAAAGQTVPTPLLLKYEAGGFNAPHRDIRGEVFFPIQMAIVLSSQADSPGAEGFLGGEFLFCDDPERKKSDRRRISAGLGDAVLFCTRERLVRIAGVYGLQPVKHGVETITAGMRYVLGVPFHEYR
jgi:Tfp pilus assembly protein PilF